MRCASSVAGRRSMSRLLHAAVSAAAGSATWTHLGAPGVPRVERRRQLDPRSPNHPARRTLFVGSAGCVIVGCARVNRRRR